MLNEIKWATRQRLEFIELIAYYTGIVTRHDVTRAFAISDAAATKDLKYYTGIAPDNLIYKHNVFGFIPGSKFQAVFTDLSPVAVLPVLEANLTGKACLIQAEAVFGIPTESLPLPNRLPDKIVVSQITRAIHNKKKLDVNYHSLSKRESKKNKVIEPHTLVNTVFRWHIRAYNKETFDFRDFVLSRVVSATYLNDDAESSMQYDDD